MPCGHFLIRYEDKFSRNIDSDSEITESPQICTLQTYYVVYQKFIKVCMNLLALLDSYMNKDHQFDTGLRYFLQKNIQN